MSSLILKQRELLGLSTTEVAHRLGVSQSTVVRLEQSEAADTITLASLRKAAEALGCELDYVFRPMARVRKRREYPGLRRSRSAEFQREQSALSEAMARDVKKQALLLSPVERIEQTCSLSDLAKELLECSKMR